MDINLYKSVNLTLPIIRCDNKIPVPGSDLRLDISRRDDLQAANTAEYYQNYVILAVEKSVDETKEAVAGFLKRAAVAKVVLKTSPNQQIIRLKFDVIMRCDIETIDATSDVLLGNALTICSVQGDADEAFAVKDLIRKEIADQTNISQEAQVNYQRVAVILERSINDIELSDALGGIVAKDLADRLFYLCELDSTKRLEHVLNDLRKEKLFNELETNIDKRLRDNMNQQQKEYYLREKLRAIQEELGDKAVKDADVEEIRKKIKESGLPKSVEEKALNELSRYQMMNTASPESGVIKTYLDFILSLPWNKSSEDCNDIAIAKQVLDEDHYGLEKVKERILEYLAVRLATNKNPQSILCLVGPPGVGKSSLAKSVARALNKQFVKQSLGGVHDESEIRGHRRTYIGALPGRILQSLAKAKVNNPVFLLDEIDKMASDYKGDPTSAMLEVLDPEQNMAFSDNYLEEPFDLSKCFFIATANYLGNIPAPLRDRLEIIELSSYTEFEKFNIAKLHLISKQLKANGIDESKFSISDDAIMEIIQHYTREAGVREVERLIGSVVRKAIKELMEKHLDKVEVNKENLTNYLGKARFENSENTGKDLVGVVTGLAYTEFGGDTLQIEVAHYPGTGKVLLTGKLGDVMKESAETALSFVKANALSLGIDYNLFNQNDIHIHVPEGAVPKDGPSAGVTMVVAIVSSFLNKPVNHLTGMTGEITLRGRILPIGGLKEKSIAAHRSGLTKILIPKENEKDIEEIPESVREKLEIVLIENASDAIKEAIIK